MLLCGTGHRPDKIGGYAERNPLRQRIRAEIARRLAAHKPSAVISGMALGFDQDLALEALAAGIPLIAAVPFEGQEATWPRAAQARYFEILAKAERIVCVSPSGYSVRKMHLRNEWMVEHVGRDGIVLACWDGSPGGTAGCLRLAELRNRKIDRIDPRDLQGPAAP